MPRLDARRVEAWQRLQGVVDELTRGVDADLRQEWAVPLGLFDVLDVLRRLGGRGSPHEVAEALRIPISSLSRRLDRLEEEGWVSRQRASDPVDRRRVSVELTSRGRALWREMRLTYRRSVQGRFASHLDDDQIEAVLSVLAQVVDEPATS
ncbi:MAG: hypothetical protein CSA55_05220 [Ilumatobacter coccineus]|uniref:HTH marR-type domain-containing protein n=1 Tax=Ilumatobacter coccineus TaxID=467094 RepID=A0A2G6K9J7_9ACTN|nr:MAG: hypothetical protein CSA55_05220 [Ilumatobacter coccineus]